MNRTTLRFLVRMVPTLVVATALLTTACASGSAGGAEGATNGATAVPTAAGTDTGGPRIVQPGAPGERTREFAGGDLERIEGAEYAAADVAFMQGMIHHHAQALEMTALVRERTSKESFRQMALRMEISQNDEIRMMQSWLRGRGLEVPDPSMHAGHMTMPGMLSAEQMRTLRDARGEDFERSFLQFMIQHHGGAIVMVQELFATPGAGQETTINFFANEVDADQTIEIRRMQQMLQELG